jgi:outer membrane protein assembly factor BamB
MKWTRRLLAAFLLIPTLSLAAWAQLPPMPIPPRVPPDSPADPDTGGNWPALVLPTEQGLTKRLEAARDYIHVKDYAKGLGQVQWVLDAPEDVLIKGKGDMGPNASYQSVRRQAESILEELTPQGRDTYRTLYDPPAKTMLEKARLTTDPQLLAEIVRRYKFTPSGETALSLLAGYYLDRGQYQQAAHRYANLLRLQPADRQPLGLLVRAATAFRATPGSLNKTAADAVAQALSGRASGGKIKLGGREFALAELEKNVGMGGNTVRFDARVFRGDDHRNGNFTARPPLLEPFVQVDAWTEPVARDLLTRARAASPKALPGRHLIASGNKILYRGAQGIVALDSVTGQQLWNAPLELGLEGLLRDAARKQQFLRWNGYYRDTLTGLLYENTLTGTLSTDGQNVYAVDDIALPVPPFMLFEQANGKRHLFSTLGPWLACNRLRAIDLATGKPAWQIGGPKNTTLAEFADVLFLGPPLPLEGLLWVLVEKQQKMVLYALDPATGNMRWSQNLGAVSDKIQMNLLRRCSAVHLAAADGLLIVPTHHGAVIGIDPLGRNLVWAHTWSDKPAINWETITPELPQVKDQWNTSYRGGAPIIAGGRIVLSGPDTLAIRCLNLGDGALAWKADSQEADLFVAGIHKNTVLVIGRNYCRGLNLANGHEVWRHTTEEPSGLGVLSDGTYWLPIQEGGLLAIDVETGKAPVRLGAPGSPVLGNLLVHEGAFWSQDALKVAAFPDVGKRLLALDDLLLLNPENLNARLERVHLRLGQGEAQAALKDVRLALANPELGPARTSRARELLYATLTQMLLREPAAATPYLGEYMALTDQPIIFPDVAPETRAKAERERVRRRIQAGGLVARGYAAAGRHRDAAGLLLRLVRDSGNELVPTPDELTVEARSDILAERYFREMLRDAPEAAQAEVRAALAQAAREPTGPGGNEGLLRLARLADLLAGPDRLALVERLITLNPSPGRVLLLLDALEGRLSNPADVAGVLLLRAEALTRAGLVADAADCYRRLGRDYGTLPVSRDRRAGADQSKTGAQVLEEARQDKRLLASFEAPPEWGAARYTVKEERVPSPELPVPLVRMTDDQGVGLLGPTGQTDPPVRLQRPPSSLARSIRVSFDARERKIHVQDLAGTTLWSIPATGTTLDRQINAPPPGGYVILGSIAVVHVNCVLYGLDLLERRVRWSFRVLEPDRNPQAIQGMAFTVQGRLEGFDGNGQFVLRVGMSGPASPDRLLIQLRGGLAAIEPATGAILWQRADVPPVVVVGDEEAVVLMETMPNDGNIKQVRSVRPSDGRVVRLAPGIKETLQTPTRLRWLGRDLLLLENNREGAGRTLRRLDLLTGKDRWTLALPEGSSVLDSLQPTVLGVLRPLAGGSLGVRPVDLTTGKESETVLEVGKGMLDANERHFLLGDERRWYIVARVPFGAQGFLNESADHVPIAVPTLAANGTLHAFDRATGRLLWRARMPGQQVITDPFEELPFLVAVSQTMREGPGGPNTPQRIVVLLRVVDKRTGKLLFNRDEEMPDNAQNPQRVPYHMPFQALTFDPLGNWLELVGPAVKVRVVGQ